MATQSSVDYPVYLGVWVNWSRGPILGSTFTTTRESGNLLIAFVAFFVAYVGTRIWRILCLVIHSIYSKQQADSCGAEGFYHQRQAILRNAASADWALMRFLQVLWAWRKSSTQFWRSILPALLAALLCFLGFATASIFSSQISSDVGTEVLLAGTQCGFLWNPYPTNISEVAAVWGPYEFSTWSSSNSYGSDCYPQADGSSSSFVECGTLIKKSLPFTVQTNASCPFAAGLCRTNDANIMLDTGLLDSNDHFGLNGPADERIQWRKTMHCAPLVSDGYRVDVNRSAEVAANDTVSRSMSVTRYMFGETQSYATDEIFNFTYEYTNLNSQMADVRYPDYYIGKVTARFQNGSSYKGDFNPIDEIANEQNRDASISILFLSSNGMRFAERTTDAWFKATTRGPGLLDVGINSSVTSAAAYLQDEPASPLACLEREQICFSTATNGRVCTPLTTSDDLMSHTDTLFGGANNTDPQYRRTVWIYNVLTTPGQDLGWMKTSLITRGLRALTRFSRNVQGPLPDNQWQIEVHHIFSVLLATIQQAFVRAALGSPSNDLNKYLVKPETPYSESLCKNQKIQSRGYTNFSMFGLMFTLVCGGIIILISYSLEPLMAFLHQRGKFKDYVYLEWVSNSTLQIQRLAHQGIRAGTWTKGTDIVPITESGEKLAFLDITDPKLPVLQAGQGSTFSRQDSEALTGLSDVQTNGNRTSILPVEETACPTTEQQ